MSQTLIRASNQWFSRPADERFISLPEMLADQKGKRERSTQKTISTRALFVEPEGDYRANALVVRDRETDETAAPTHFAFNQIAKLVGAPAGYLRTLPTPTVADALNWGLRFNRDIGEVQTLVRRDREDLSDDTLADEVATLRAATGPNYGRVWNADMIEHLIDRFGDGVSGTFRVPGEFQKAVTVDRANTTLYAGDRDMFVFLADEVNRIEIPNRRNGESGALARGFFVWNSEVGSTSFGVAMFLFDYACRNRTVWGAENYSEVRVRHTASAPDKFLEEIAPALEAMHTAETSSITEAIKQARGKRLADEADDWLAKRFSKNLAEAFELAHIADEGRPMETLYDVVNGVTAYARGVSHQNDRVKLEREAGKILALAQ